MNPVTAAAGITVRGGVGRWTATDHERGVERARSLDVRQDLGHDEEFEGGDSERDQSGRAVEHEKADGGGDRGTGDGDPVADERALKG